MPAASISRARPRSLAMCVLQIGQSTNRRSCRWTRRLGSGSLIDSPVTDSRVVAGTISPGLNFMFIHSLLFVSPASPYRWLERHAAGRPVDVLYFGSGRARQEDLGALGGELLCDRRANRSSGCKHERWLSFQD